METARRQPGGLGTPSRLKTWEGRFASASSRSNSSGVNESVTGPGREHFINTDVFLVLELEKQIETVKFVTEQIEELKFNTAIAQLMIFVNAANKEEKLYVEYAKGFIQLLAPFAPHLAEELWQAVAQTGKSISAVDRKSVV